MRGLSLLALMFVPNLALAEQPNGLPAEWHGTWQGTLAELGERNGYAIEVIIAPKAKSQELELTVAYTYDGKKKNRQELKYNLLPNPPKDLKIKTLNDKPNRRIGGGDNSNVVTRSSGKALWITETERSAFQEMQRMEDVTAYRFELKDGNLSLEMSQVHFSRSEGIPNLIKSQVFDSAPILKLAELKPVK